MIRFCVIAVFQKEPCRQPLRASVCYCTGRERSDIETKTKDIGNHIVTELFFDTESDAMCYVRRINGGRLRYDTERDALVEHIEREEP